MHLPTTTTFQSLPIGIYRLDFDLSELSEPLVPRAPVAPLIVTGKDTKSITVTLDPRPIRMRNGSGPRGVGEAKKNYGPSTDKTASGPGKQSNQ